MRRIALEPRKKKAVVRLEDRGRGKDILHHAIDEVSRAGGRADGSHALDIIEDKSRVSGLNRTAAGEVVIIGETFYGS